MNFEKLDEKLSRNQKYENINLLSDDISESPFFFYKYLREKNPVKFMNNEGFYLISRYEDIRSVLLNARTFSSKGCHKILQPTWLKNDTIIKEYILAFEDKPEHTKHKCLIAKYFRPSAIQKLAPFIFKTAERLTNSLPERTEIDFITLFVNPYVNHIICRLIGIEESTQLEKLRLWVDLIDRPPGQYCANYIEALKKENKSASAFFDSLVNEYKTKPKNGLIASLKKEKLSDNMIKEIIELLVLSGLQSLRYTLTQSIIQLSSESKYIGLLKSNSATIKTFVEELLRRDTHEHFVARRAIEDTNISGTPIPKESSIVLLLASANHDHSQFTSPEIFDLSRGNVKQHLSFSVGEHYCIGAELVRSMVSASLKSLVSRFSEITIPRINQLPKHFTYTSYGKSKLPVFFSK